MILTLKQPDVEQAISDYIAKLGIKMPVDEISFSVARSEGNSVTTEITFSQTAAKSEPTPRAVAPKAETTPPAAVEDLTTETNLTNAEPPAADTDADNVAPISGKSLFG